ncbi:MAG: aminotransferase class I/II-fold pyridoxal phosphate-dependent enzyme [Candidatus Latescibacteria bacterium]|jgi:threonine aldolase|nr:aminotransferase class I/II-fold pyridoxal phosphate-dependent enzyme [Candidatus Latescibacterota bacterium]
MEIVELRSDTMTKPSPGMREAIAGAEVGDDCFGEDPTVNKLEESMARMLGKEAAVFVTSGTQGNQIAIRTQTHHGNEIVAEESSHIFISEAGALGALSGVQPWLLPGENGVITPAQIEPLIRPKNVHYGRIDLVSIENTHNKSGGTPWPMESLVAVAEFTQAHKIRLHMDGARLFNAAAATGIPARDYASHVDTVSVCLSKGLGAPVGSVLSGDEETIDRARYFRKMFGGGLRQGGILAAAGLYAMEHNITRLSADHANARRLAAGLSNLDSVKIDTDAVRSNMVFFRLRAGLDHTGFVAELGRRGVRMLAQAGGVVRAVTHLDVTEGQIDQALEICQSVLMESN